MNAKDRRTLAFLGLHLFVFPVFIGAVALINVIRSWLNLSEGSHAFLLFASFGLIYIGTGYLLASWLRRLDG